MSGMSPYDAIAAELRQIVHHEGPGVWRDRSRLMGLLLDQQPELRREIRAVVTAVEQGVAQALTGCEPSLTAISIDRHANLLESEANLRPDVAQNVTRAIAHALNMGPMPSVYGHGGHGGYGAGQGGGAQQPPYTPPPVDRREPERAPQPPTPQAAWDQSHGSHGSQNSHGGGYGGHGAPPHGQWNSQPRADKGNRNVIIGTSVAGGVVVIGGIIAALTLGGGGSGGGTTTNGQSSRPGVIDAAYLQGRWCDRTNSWMTFDNATRQINLPNGNTGQRVIATYVLSGNTITITGPSGVVQTVTATWVDQQSMNMVFPSLPAETVRRC